MTSPFAAPVSDAGSANRPRKGSVNQLQSVALGSVSSAKSPLSRGPLSHAGSPARMMMAAATNGSSPGTSSNHNVPSPATFAHMAAAVGVQTSLEDTAQGGGAVPKATDAYTELLASIESFLTVQLAQLEAAGNAFFDEYEGVLDEEADLRRVVGAHQHLMSVFDHVLSTSTHLGIAALPCPAPGSSTKASTLEEMHARLMAETKETFERRERLGEGASMVTSILTQNQGRRSN